MAEDTEIQAVSRRSRIGSPTCGACRDEALSTHPDHSPELRRLRRARGQIRGIEKMIEERRYCIEILTQLQAAKAALGALEAAVLSRHVESCVRDAIESRDPKESRRKVDELTKLLLRSQS